MILHKYNYIFLFFVICGYGAFAQNISLTNGSAAGFGVGQSTAAWNDVHAATNNQAGILGIEKWGMQVSAANAYGLSSLNILSASAIRKIDANQAVSLSIKHTGDSDFNNQIIGLAYARKILSVLSLSLQGDLLTYQAKQYGNKYLATVEIGTMYQATKKIRVGFHVFNPFSQKLTEKEYIPSVLRLGLLYDLSNNVKLMGEIEKDLIYDYNLKIGIDYQPIEKLNIRVGFNTAGKQFHMGLAYAMGDFTVHGSASVHQQLGISSAAEISYQK